MPVLNANSHPVSSGRISFPRSGRAVATLLLAVPAEDKPVLRFDPVTLLFEDGTTLETTCLDGGSNGAWWDVRLVGGAGKLDKVVPKRFYQGIPASTVAGDILRDCGEAAGTVDLPGTLNYWARLEQPAWQALGHLLKGFQGYAWRVGLDGRVNIGAEKWPEYSGIPDVLEADPAARRYVLGLAPDLAPGVSLKGILAGQQAALGNVERVLHRMEDKLRTEVWTGGR